MGSVFLPPVYALPRATGVGTRARLFTRVVNEIEYHRAVLILYLNLGVGEPCQNR